MMLDSVKLRSPYLTEEVAAAIQDRLQLRQAIDLETGWVMWEFVSGPVHGSYDHRISVSLRRQTWVSETVKGRTTTRPEDCPPYIEVEGSVHKAMLGHNVEEGPVLVCGAIGWFVAELSHQLGVELPPAAEWIVRRLDWAEVFWLGSDGVGRYLAWLHSCAFPRRRVHRVEGQSLTVPGNTTTLKVYHKGQEFRAHDRKRLLQFGGGEYRPWVEQLQERANGLMRVEVAIKAPTLDRAFGQAPTVALLCAGGDAAEYCRAIWAREVKRLLREGAIEMDIVRHDDAVTERLFNLYPRRMAKTLHSSWVLLATRGEPDARLRLGRATFYRHRRQLVDAGVSWRGTDLRVLHLVTQLPLDFTPSLTDARRLTQVAATVEQRCLRHAV